MNFTTDELKRMYTTMVLIRKFEQNTIEIFAERMKRGDFPGALHSSEGQEAIAVGVSSQLLAPIHILDQYIRLKGGTMSE